MSPAGDDRQADIAADLRLKIRTVVERVGVTDTAVDIIIDLVARGLGRMGGRPPDPDRKVTRSKRVTNGLEPVTNGLGTPSGGVSGSALDLDLFSEIPDQISSQQSECISKEMEENPPQGGFRPALAAFCSAWKARYGVSYIPSPAELNQLGIAVKRVPKNEDFNAIFAAYLGDLSPFVAQDMRHSLLHFCTKGGFNKYRTSAPILSAREARGVAAGRRFINGEDSNGRKG